VFGKSDTWKNGHKTRAARQDAARQLLSDIIEGLGNGHNPVTRNIGSLPTDTAHLDNVQMANMKLFNLALQLEGQAHSKP
jgi:hypothetical protein